MLEFFRGLKKRYRLRTVAVSNEGHELTVYRNEKFMACPACSNFFVSSCFVRMRKPDPDIYRLALDLAQVRTSEVVYVENTEMFVDVARGSASRRSSTRDSKPRSRPSTSSAHPGLTSGAQSPVLSSISKSPPYPLAWDRNATRFAARVYDRGWQRPRKEIHP